MLIEVNTGNTIQGGEELNKYIKEMLESALSNFADQVTRVEVNLSDQNGAKGGGEDKHCAMEVRLANRKPTAVTCNAETLDLAILGATDKLKHSIEHILGRLYDH